MRNDSTPFKTVLNANQNSTFNKSKAEILRQYGDFFLDDKSDMKSVKSKLSKKVKESKKLMNYSQNDINDKEISIKSSVKSKTKSIQQTLDSTRLKNKKLAEEVDKMKSFLENVVKE